MNLADATRDQKASSSRLREDVMQDYNAMPMLLPAAEIARAVAEILAEARSDAPPPALDVAEALVGMVVRQSSHHGPFDPETAASIERWAAQCWSPTDPELADALATLLVNTDTGIGRRVLVEACASPVPEVRLIAEQALLEL